MFYSQQPRTTQSGFAFFANLHECDFGTMSAKPRSFFNVGVAAVNEENDAMKICQKVEDDVDKGKHLGSVSKSSGNSLCSIPMRMSVITYITGAYIDWMATLFSEKDPDVFVGYLDPKLESTRKVIFSWRMLRNLLKRTRAS